MSYCDTLRDVIASFIMPLLCTVFVLFFPSLAEAASSVDTTNWTMDFGETIVGSQLSEDGKYLVVCIDTDEDNIQCVKMSTGDVVWRATVTYDTEKFWGKFVDSETFLLCRERQYEFRAIANGTVLAELPIMATSWDNIADAPWNGATGFAGYVPGQYEPAQPRFFGKIGVFYFQQGMQILNLKERTVLYKSGEVAETVRYEAWNDHVLILPSGSCEHLFIIDTAKNELVYTMESNPEFIEEQLAQHIITAGNQMMFFAVDEIICIDLAKKQKTAALRFSVKNMMGYYPITIASDLYLFTSFGLYQTLYRCRDGKLMWELNDSLLFGAVDNAYLHSNGKDLVVLMCDGKQTSAAVIDFASGQLRWARPLFSFSGGYKIGNYFPATSTSVWAIAGALVAGLPMLLYHSGYYVIPAPYGTPTPLPSSDILAPMKSCAGIATFLRAYDPSHIVLAMSGYIYTTLNLSSNDRYNGEGFVVLNLSNGAVVSYEQVPILSDMSIRDRDKEVFNAVQYTRIAAVRYADVVVGQRHAYVVSNERVVSLAMNPDDDTAELLCCDWEKSSVICSINRDGEAYEYWQIDAGTLPVKVALRARTETRLFVFPEAATFPCSIISNSEGLSGYDVDKLPLDGQALPPARWLVSADSLDDMDIGNFRRRGAVSSKARDSLQGISFIDGDLYLTGRDGVGMISGDGRCRWSIPWNVKIKHQGYPVAKVGAYLLYSTGVEFGIVRAGCGGGTVVERHEVSTDDLIVCTDQKSNLVVARKEQGTVHRYVIE